MPLRALSLFLGFLLLFACSSATVPSISGGGGTGGGSGTAGTGALPACGLPVPVEGPGIVIQEDELGFSGVDGLVYPREGSTSITGYTGCGFLDGDSGIGNSMSWSVAAESAGTYSLVWRYAFGGTETNLRDGRLLVNGVVVTETVTFAYTGTWNDWQETPPLEVALAEGPNLIRLEATGASGLANVDYLRVVGEGTTPTTPSFSLTVDVNDPDGGTVSFEPELPYYEAGALVTLRATANAGYFFQSFSGDVTGAEAELAFPIAGNTHVTAIFLPDGATQAEGLVGYAGVQDDAGTPYLVTGGSLGETVAATSVEELREYLARPEPTVVTFDGTFTGAELIDIASNKTLRGGTAAHLQGIGLQVNGARNVIIQNIAVSHVIAEGAGEANDAIELTGGAKNVWIDHCEFYSDRDNGEDYYDGLVELKNGASFVTVSWSHFHDHHKVSLISSGDEQVGDVVIRATYHHNYFHDVGSRLPSIRFGKAHVFDNYYVNVANTGVNSRMGAVVRVEHNYFETSDDPIGSWDSSTVGTWDVVNNVFDTCNGSQPTTSTGSLIPPYEYALDAPEELPSLVPAGAGVDKL